MALRDSAPAVVLPLQEHCVHLPRVRPCRWRRAPLMLPPPLPVPSGVAGGGGGGSGNDSGAFAVGSPSDSDFHVLVPFRTRCGAQSIHDAAGSSPPLPPLGSNTSPLDELPDSAPDSAQHSERPSQPRLRSTSRPAAPHSSCSSQSTMFQWESLFFASSFPDCTSIA